MVQTPFGSYRVHHVSQNYGQSLEDYSFVGCIIQVGNAQHVCIEKLGNL